MCTVLSMFGLLMLSAETASGVEIASNFTRWPGSAAITTADARGAFESNLSGLTYQAAAGDDASVLWAVQNNPSILYRLEQRDGVWASSAREGWSAGKTISYPDGTGIPDSEGLTLAESDSPAIYIATERDNTAGGTSRLSVLRVDPRSAGTMLIATHEWNLTASLPSVGPNLGLETITWIPDSYLVARGLREDGGGLYDPSNYPSHGSGIFLVGVEASGVIYAFALNHADSTSSRIATIPSGHAHVVGLEFDRDQNVLWSYCDDTCGNRATLLALSPTTPSPGHFEIIAAYDPPSGMSNLNNEGIAIAPESECRDGEKSFFWADDGSTGLHALRVGTVPCAPWLQ